MVDVVAVSLLNREVLWVEPNKTDENADAVIKMAVMRQGVEDRFLATAKPGIHVKGDTYDAFGE